nr:MAG TPA: hypothetical protein [Caudoviricetes sp.]
MRDYKEMVKMRVGAKIVKLIKIVELGADRV